jgi:hypothetical protein
VLEISIVFISNITPSVVTLQISPGTKSNMTHNVTKLLQMKDNMSHVNHILLHKCQICLTNFSTHSVPNTTQVKRTEDNCEANFTQHVSRVTLCRCQIYSVSLHSVVSLDMSQKKYKTLNYKKPNKTKRTNFFCSQLQIFWAQTFLA